MSDATENSWEIGLARGDITAWEPGMGMMGWGNFAQRVRGVAERLSVRAVVIRDGHDLVCIAVLDLCMVPLLLRTAIVSKLEARAPISGFRGHNVMLLATHTHSAPAGLSDSPLYNSVNFGFSPAVFDHVVQVTVSTIEAALNHCQRGAVRIGRALVPHEVPVAFNRSLDAFNLNADVTPTGRAEEATDRDMVVLRFEDAKGEEIGAMSWFASHGTSVHSDSSLLHPDHLGLAASRVEAMRGAGSSAYVALFAQSAAGDVTPNHRPCPERGFTICRAGDDFAAASHLAEVEAHLACKALAAAKEAPVLEGPIDSYTRHFAIAETRVDPDFAFGVEGIAARPARMGLPFMLGTREGAGPLGSLRAPIERWMRQRHATVLAHSKTAGVVAAAQQDPMVTVLDLAAGIEGKFFRLVPARSARLVARFDPGSAFFAAASAHGALDRRAWVPPIVPAQLMRIGPVVIAAVAGEPTTQAGRRIRAAVLQGVEQRGVMEVLVAGYANAYTSYITTPEEYLMQRYEGGCTLFGRWTLGAWCTVLRAMSRERWPSSSVVPGPEPITASRGVLLQERHDARARLGRFGRWVEGQREGLIMH